MSTSFPTAIHLLARSRNRLYEYLDTRWGGGAERENKTKTWESRYKIYTTGHWSAVDEKHFEQGRKITRMTVH